MCSRVFQVSSQTTIKSQPAKPGPSAEATNRSRVQQVTAQQIAHHSVFRDFDKIEGIAYYNMAGVENITLKSENPTMVAVYSLLLSDDPYLISSDMPLDAVTSLAAQSNGRHFILYRDMCEISIHNWPLDLDDPSFTQDTKKDPSSHVCCTPSHYFYDFKQDGSVRVACMSTMRMPPKLEWSVHTGIGKVRAMNVMENEHGTTVLVSQAVAYGQKVQTQDVALKALNAGGCLWQMTYHQLENNSKQFDLRSIANDGQNFFVLNSRTRAVHVISRSGQHVNKVLTNLSKPVCLSINQEAKKMAVVENNKHVKLYQLTYV